MNTQEHTEQHPHYVPYLREQLAFARDHILKLERAIAGDYIIKPTTKRGWAMRFAKETLLENARLREEIRELKAERTKLRKKLDGRILTVTNVVPIEKLKLESGVLLPVGKAN